MPSLPTRPVPPVLPKKGRRKDSALHRMFVGPLDWYDDLPREKRNAIDQTLHVFAGFFLGFFLPGWASWAICHYREFVKQAPIERIADTEQDMRFWLLGTAMGWSARWGLITGWVSHVLSKA